MSVRHETEDRGKRAVDPVMAPFFEMMRRYKAVVIYLFSFGAAPQLLNYLLAIGPPWPHRTAIAGFTGLITWIVLLFTFACWERLAQIRMRVLVGRFSGLTICSLLIYIGMMAFFLIDAPDEHHQEARGWRVRPEVEELVDATYTIEEAFLESNYEAKRVWEPWTVSVNRLMFLVSWLATWGSLSFVVSVFVLLQTKKYESQKKKEEKKMEKDEDEKK